MMYSLFAVPVLLAAIAVGCTGATPGQSTVVLKTDDEPASAEGPQKSGNVSQQQQQTTQPAPAKIAHADVKSQCASCHSSASARKDAWTTANGGEEEWKKVAVVARDKVSKGTMPPSPVNAEVKKKLLAYFDQLIAAGGAAGSPPAGGAAPAKFSFADASALCAGCHNDINKVPLKKIVPLVKMEDWNNRLNICRYELEAAVATDQMPQNNKLDAMAKSDLLAFIKSLDEDNPACLDKLKKAAGMNGTEPADL